MGNLISIDETRAASFHDVVDSQRSILINGVAIGRFNVSHDVYSTEMRLTLSVSMRLNNALLQNKVLMAEIENSFQYVTEGTVSSLVSYDLFLELLEVVGHFDELLKFVSGWSKIDKVHIQWFHVYRGRRI